jgi:hypothetical protein
MRQIRRDSGRRAKGEMCITLYELIVFNTLCYAVNVNESEDALVRTMILKINYHPVVKGL